MTKTTNQAYLVIFVFSFYFFRFLGQVRKNSYPKELITNRLNIIKACFTRFLN